MVIRTILDKRRANKEQKFPIKLRFTDRNKSAYASLGIYAFPDEFNEASGTLVALNKKDQRKVNQDNAVILSCFEKAETILRDHRKQNRYISPSKLKELYEESDTPVEEFEEVTFNSYFRKAIEARSGKTKVAYQNTLNKIEGYFQDELRFEEIDKSWLKAFIKKMQNDKIRRKNVVQSGLSINTQSIHLRNVRSVYNDAIDDKIIGYDMYPFRKFNIESEEVKHRAITVEQLRKVFQFTGTDSENWARDVSKLMFFLIGINAADLYNLSEIKNGYIHYRRSKTGRLYAIKLEHETLTLIEHFKGKNSLLCFQEQYSDINTFLKKVNGQTLYKNGDPEILKRGLNTIGDALGISGLTSYVLRHTWATIAGRLEIPKETIAAALGHGKKTVTDIYIDFDQKKIDEANRKVIDYVFG